MFYNNPYLPYQQGYPSQVSQQNYQPQSAVVVAYVSGIEGAKSFTLNPNGKAFLFDSERLVVYYKEADISGKYTLKAFTMTEFDINTPSTATNDYVTKDELKNLKADIEQRLSAIFQTNKNGKSKEDGQLD